MDKSLSVSKKKGCGCKKNKNLSNQEELNKQIKEAKDKIKQLELNNNSNENNSNKDNNTNKNNNTNKDNNINHNLSNNLEDNEDEYFKQILSNIKSYDTK